MNDAVDETLGEWRRRIDHQLATVAAASHPIPDRLRAAIHYSLTGEGKRFRGLLLLASYDALGGRDVNGASELAAAIEIVHAYSLVHDDLPCMDNDSIRRGRPTTHRAYDVATATATGVIMVPLAVRQTVAAGRTLALPGRAVKQLVGILMRASGASGMVGGQLMDLHGEGRRLSVAELERVHRSKTGALITAAFTMGGMAAGGDDRAVASLAAAGEYLGLAFQIADDVLDATESSESLGKTAGADAALAKSTYASVLGVVPARRRSETLVAQGMGRLEDAGLRSAPLERLAHFVSARRS